MLIVLTSCIFLLAYSLQIPKGQKVLVARSLLVEALTFIESFSIDIITVTEDIVRNSTNKKHISRKQYAANIKNKIF